MKHLLLLIATLCLALCVQAQVDPSVKYIQLKPTPRITPAVRPAGQVTAQPGTATPGGNTPPPTAEIDTERKGPSNTTFGEWQRKIKGDYNFDLGYNFVNINRTIFRDANPKSGYFYYLPEGYTLNWSVESGYAFHVNFLSAGADGRGNVIVTAELKPNITSRDMELAKLLLQQDLAVETEKTFKDLISMPLASAPKVSFNQQFGEAISNVQVNISSDFLRPITISWKMDRVDDLLSGLFNNIGLNGQIIIEPAGENMPSEITIPITLKLDAPETFGRLEPSGNWRTTWANPTPYPLTMKYLHVLRMDKYNGNKPVVYTWSMDNQNVPEKASVKFDASSVPVWLETDPTVKKMWFDYQVVPCQSCNTTVKESIVRGTSSRRVNKVDFTLLTPLSATGTAMMKIQVRSFQADPNGLSKVQMPTITVKSDNTSVSPGELIIPEGQGPDFEYMIDLYKEDGTKYSAAQWTRCTSLEVVIGKKQIGELIPEFSNLR